ncbi:signal peptidase I [Lacrimispora sp.]|uniref:signal peptidase I n=1 Tax=Lacrimispora sp. TaxID=2719234 RepID=UPI00345F3E6D
MDFYHSEDNNKFRHLVNWIVDIIVVIAFAWFLVYAYGTQIVIAGHSMSPLLESEDVVLMDRISYDFGRPIRFDVVVFQREDQKMNVKRVIGLPGETVQIKNDEIYIDGEKLKEPEGLGRVSLSGLAEKPVKLGEDEYFLLGDNRDSSEDSRFSNIGNVSGRQIQGKVWFRMRPFSRMELIRSK